MSKNFISWNDPESIDVLRDSLAENNVAVGSSDTVFGLLANTNPAGFSSLNSIKERVDKPYIVLINEIDKLKHFVDIDSAKNVIDLLEFCWPGPLTMIFRAKEGVPEYLVSKDHKIALRVPKHNGLLKILEHFDGLFSTSANLSGKSVPSLVEDLDSEILDKTSLVVLDENVSDKTNTVVPSTILDCSGDEIKVIRVGAYSIDSLKKVCKSPIIY